ILGTTLYIGFRRNSADLRQLMINEAERLMEVVSISAEAGIHALDEIGVIEQTLGSKVFDLIERMTRTQRSLLDSLNLIAEQNDLHMINILDKDGASVKRSRPQSHGNKEAETKHRPEVESVLSGETSENIIGLTEGRYYKGMRYGVVVERQTGGAIVVNTDSGDMLEFRKTVGLGTLFREIGSREGVQYIVLQDTLGIVAASSNVTKMTRVYDDPFLIRAYHGGLGSRVVEAAGGFLEVVRPLVVDDIHLGLLRIGLSTAEIDGIRSRALKQFFLLFAVSVISGIFVLSFVILMQNYLILNDEHDRILSEVRRMEEQTRRSERLSSMGQLAAGVAHEIRNPLNSVSIITQRLKAEFTSSEDSEEYGSLLSTVGKEISRISSIVENFMKYARPPKLSLSTVSVEKIASEVRNVVEEKAKSEHVTIVTEIESGLLCSCDADQMKQALLNIVLNALDAAGENGTVFIRAEMVSGEIIIRVTDTGPGISMENLSKIFDPYFTTKDTGTGLGLSEVHRIVTAHKGRITVDNADEGGVVFSIWLGKVQRHRDTKEKY
ncbi:sensor histidine kinase, partial [Candidatus Latescibacterota bacterium]